jgi:transposase
MEQKYIRQFITEIVFPSAERKLADCLPKLRATAAHLHVDNATPHPSKMSFEKTEELGFTLVPQPPYSPDLALCDFFLFGCLKRHLEGKQFTTEDQVFSTLREIFDKRPLQTFQNVMDD